ncbi:MAG: exodeoxyribonuclease III, partial [Gallionellaceae bacterium]
LNLNGIRSAYNKGLLEWLGKQDTDILCVQELKAQADNLTADMIAPHGYHGHFHYAEKKGYSGVAIYSKRKPDKVVVGLGIAEIDNEGRYIEAQFGNLTVVSVYLPSGSSGEERQAYKYKFMEVFMPHLAALKDSGREIIICGDWNIAHTEKDIKNWRGNKKNSGFLPEERAWLSELFNKVGFVDVFRKLQPELESYTWWSNRGQALAKDVGWRLDYQVTTPAIAEKAISTGVYKDQRFSDHAPMMVDYKLQLE